MRITPPNWSIRWKLTFLAMLTMTVALVLTVAAFAMFEYVTFRQHFIDRMQTLGEVIGGNSTAAIAFNRPDDASATLATLAAQPSIRAASIYTAEGNILATYVAGGAPALAFPQHPSHTGFVITRDAMDAYLPIRADGKIVGTVYLRSDLSELYSRLYSYTWISVGILLAASLAGFLLVSRLQRYISGPIVALADLSRRVSEQKDYSLRAPQHDADELGRLAHAFNDMLEGIRLRDQQIQEHLREVQSARDLLEQRVADRTADLTRANQELQAEMQRRQEAETKREQMQANLIEASRKAGMADVATGVLHNVGNVLNSVNVSTQLVQDALKSSRLPILRKTADLVQEHASDLPQFLTSDQRGKTLPTFLLRLAETLSAEHEALHKELDGLASNIGHIREIVAMQQSFARASGVVTAVTLGEMVDSALKINQAGLLRHHVELVRDFDPALTLATDPHKVLQILINLISNAKYAVTDAPVKRITVRARLCDPDMLAVSVIDTGAGIAPENMTRIFSYGFTTKKQGHGFGLHSSALTAKELGGSLKAHSDGPGSGAAFTLTLPLRSEARAHV